MVKPETFEQTVSWDTKAGRPDRKSESLRKNKVITVFSVSINKCPYYLGVVNSR
jgi:hypothetical protein